MSEADASFDNPAYKKKGAQQPPSTHPLYMGSLNNVEQKTLLSTRKEVTQRNLGQPQTHNTGLYSFPNVKSTAENLPQFHTYAIFHEEQNVLSIFQIKPFQLSDVKTETRRTDHIFRI